VEWGRRVTAGFDGDDPAHLPARHHGVQPESRLLAALLYALAVLPTQLAHFWTMDPYLTFFATLAVLLSTAGAPGPGGVVYGRNRGRARARRGVQGERRDLRGGAHLAVALRIALRDQPRLGLRWRGVEPKRAENAPLWQWANDVSMLCLAGAIALIVFRVAQPYAFEGPSFWDMAFNQRWWDDIQREREFQQGNADYPPFVQFAGTTPFLTPLKNMILWGSGLRSGWRHGALWRRPRSCCSASGR
jgi:hypothetical protein